MAELLYGLPFVEHPLFPEDEVWFIRPAREGRDIFSEGLAKVLGIGEAGGFVAGPSAAARIREAVVARGEEMAAKMLRDGVLA